MEVEINININKVQKRMGERTAILNYLSLEEKEEQYLILTGHVREPLT